MITNSPAFMVLTWGCQMNEDDSEQMASVLMQMGYRKTETPEEADVILLNTCAVREKPEQKVRSKLGELKDLKITNPDLIIGVCGCMAQRRGADIRRRAPYVDLIIGTAQVEKLPELISKIKLKRHPLSALELPRAATDEAFAPDRVERYKATRLKAFVPITYGCNNFCSYCVVPFVRGKERSRAINEIVDEVTRLAESGCKEITLLGQNVNSYSGPGDHVSDFPELLKTLNDIDGLKRIRFMTSHPKDLSDRLIQAMVELPKVCEHIHLPIQSGDDDILSKMNRKYGFDHYKGLIKSLRDAIPNVAISTDIIVGFPGETEEQFHNTLRAVEEIQYDAAFMFAFNAIPKTAAAALPDQLPTKLKNERLTKLVQLQNNIAIDCNKRQVGNVLEVLVEGISSKNSNRLSGLSRESKTVNFEGSHDLIGKTVKVRSNDAHLYGFTGDLVVSD